MKVHDLRNRGTKLKNKQIHFKTNLNLPKYGIIEGFEVDEVLFSLLDGLMDNNEKVKETIIKTLMKFANYQPDFILKSILTFLQVQKTSINHQYFLLTVVKKCILELKNNPNGIIKEILLFMLKELSFLKPSDPRHVEMREIVNTATILCPSFSVDVILTLIKDINQSEEYFEILCIYVRILTHLCTAVPKNSYVKSILISSHIMGLYNKEVFKEQNGEICKELSSLLYAISNMLLISTYVNPYYEVNTHMYSLYSTNVLLYNSRSEEDFKDQDSHSGLYKSLDLENNTYREFDESYRSQNSNLNDNSNDSSRISYVPDIVSTSVHSSNKKVKKMVRPTIENIKNILEPLYGLMLDYYIPKIYINPSYNNTCLEILYSLIVISEYVSIECFRNNSINLLKCIIVRFLNYVPDLQLNDDLWFKLYKINSSNFTNKFVSLFSNTSAMGEMPPKFFIGGLRIYLQVLSNCDRYTIYTNSYNLCNILFSLLVILYNINNKYLILYLKNFVSSTNGSFVNNSQLLSNGNFSKNDNKDNTNKENKKEEDECDGFYVDNIVGCLKTIFEIGSSGLILMEFLYNKLTSGFKADLIMSLYVYILLLDSNKHFTSKSSSLSSDRSSSNDNDYSIVLFKVIDNINNIFNQNFNDNYSLYILVQFVNMLLLNNYIEFYVSYNCSRMSSLVSVDRDYENLNNKENNNNKDTTSNNNKDNKEQKRKGKETRNEFGGMDDLCYKDLMKKRNKRVYYIMNYIVEYKINIDINNRVNRNLKLYNSYGKKKLDTEFFLTLYHNNPNTPNKNDSTGNKIFVKNDLVGDEENMFEECVDNFIKYSGEQFLHYLMSKLMNNVNRNSLSVLRCLYKLFDIYKPDVVKRVLDEDELLSLLVLVLIYIHDPIYYFGEAYYSSKLLFMLYSVVFSQENSGYFGFGKFDCRQILRDSGVMLSNLANYTRLDSFYVNTHNKDTTSNKDNQTDKDGKENGEKERRESLNENEDNKKEDKNKNKTKEYSFLNTNDIVSNFTNVSRLVKYLNTLYMVDGSRVVRSVSVLVKKLKNKPMLNRTSSFSFSAPSFLNTSSSLFSNSSSLFGGNDNSSPLKVNDIVIDTDLNVIQNFGVLNVICMFMNHSSVSSVINTILSTNSSGGVGIKEEVSVDLISDKGDVVKRVLDEEEYFMFWENNCDIKYTLLTLSSICISNLSNEENFEKMVLKLDYLMIMNPLKDTAFSLFGKTSSYLQSERIRLMIVSALTHIYVQAGEYFARKEEESLGKNTSSNKDTTSNQEKKENKEEDKYNKRLGREEVMKLLNNKYNEIVSKLDLKREKVLLAEKENETNKSEQLLGKDNKEQKRKEKEEYEDEEDILSRYIVGPLINMFNNESDTGVQEYLLSNLLLITANCSRVSSLASVDRDSESNKENKDNRENKQERNKENKDNYCDVEIISVIFTKLIGILMKLINESYKLNDKNVREQYENNEILNLTKVERNVNEKEQTLPYYCFMLMASFSPHFRMFRNTDFPYLVLYYILYYSDYYTFVKVAKFDLLFPLNYSYHKTLKVSRCVHYYLTNLYRNLAFNVSGCGKSVRLKDLGFMNIDMDESCSTLMPSGSGNFNTNMNKMDWSVLYNIVITVLSDNNNVENLLVRNRLYILVQFLDGVLSGYNFDYNKSVSFNLVSSKGENISSNKDNKEQNSLEQLLGKDNKSNEEDENNWVRIVILVWSYILKVSDNNVKLLLIDLLYKLLDIYYGEFGDESERMDNTYNKDTTSNINKDNKEQKNFSLYYGTQGFKANNIVLRLDKISKLNSIDNINKLIPEKLTLKFMLVSVNYLENSSYISNSLVKILHRILQTSVNKIPVEQLQSSLIVIFKRFQQYFQNNNLPLFLRTFLVDVFKYNINILFNVLFNYNIKFQSTVIFIIIKNDYLLHLLIKFLHQYINSQLNLCFYQCSSFTRSSSLDSKESGMESGNLNYKENEDNKSEQLLAKDNKEQIDKLERFEDLGFVNIEMDESYSTFMFDRESKDVVLDYLLEYNMNMFNNNNKLIGCYSDYVNLLVVYINILSYFDKVALLRSTGGVKDSDISSKEAVEKRENKMIKLLQMMNNNNINYKTEEKKQKEKNKKTKTNRDLILYNSVNIIGKNKQVLKSFLNYTYEVVSSFYFGTNQNSNTSSNKDITSNQQKVNKDNNEQKRKGKEGHLLFKRREELLREVLMRMLIDLVRYNLIVGYDSKILKIMNLVNKNKIQYELVYYYLKNMYGSQLNPYYNIFGVKYSVIKRKRNKFMEELIDCLVYDMENGNLIDGGSVYYYMKVISRVLEIVSKTKKFKKYQNKPDFIISFVVENKTFFVNKRLRYAYLVMYCSIMKYLKVKYGNMNKLENLRTYLLFPTCVAILCKNTKSLVKVSNKYLKLFVSLFFGNCFNFENVNLYEEIFTGLMVRGSLKSKCLCNCNNYSGNDNNTSSSNKNDKDNQTNINKEQNKKDANKDNKDENLLSLSNINTSPYCKNLCISYTFQLLYYLSYFLPVSDSSVSKDSGGKTPDQKEGNDEYFGVPANISEEFKRIKKSQLDQKSSEVLFRNSVIDKNEDKDSEDEEFVDVNDYYGLKLKLDGTTSCSLSRSSSYSILNKEPVLRPSFNLNNNKNNSLVELENMSVSPDSLVLLLLCDYSVKEGSPKSNFKYSSDSIEEYLAMNKNAKNLSLLRLKSINSISNSFLFLSTNIYRFITMQKYLQNDLIPINFYNFSSLSDNNLTSTLTLGDFSFNTSFYSNVNLSNNSTSSNKDATSNNNKDNDDETIEDSFVLNSIKLCIFIMTKSSLYISNSNSNHVMKSYNTENDKSVRIIRKNHLVHFESLCNIVIMKLCKLIENNKFKLYTYKQLQHLSIIIPH